MHNVAFSLQKMKSEFSKLYYNDEGNYFKGNLHIYRLINDEIIDECVGVRICLNHAIPYAYDICDIISKQYPHIYNNSKLCVGIDAEQKIFLNEGHDLNDWIHKYLEGYYAIYFYFKKYGVYPNGQYQHGIPGILEFYYKYFNLNDIPNKFFILKYIMMNRYNGGNWCPCGEEKRLRSCHSSIILDCKSDKYIELLKKEYLENKLYEYKI